METWIDELHVVHDDTRGHTGGCISCGVDIIHGKASKQNMNTKITTELEVVAVRKYVTYKIYMIDIFLGKGYNLYKNIFYQDNESAIKI